jgi:hypothetical protein
MTSDPAPPQQPAGRSGSPPSGTPSPTPAVPATSPAAPSPRKRKRTPRQRTTPRTGHQPPPAAAPADRGTSPAPPARPRLLAPATALAPSTPLTPTTGGRQKPTAQRSSRIEKHQQTHSANDHQGRARSRSSTVVLPRHYAHRPGAAVAAGTDPSCAANGRRSLPTGRL